MSVKSATGQGFKQTQWLNGKTQHLRNSTKCFTLLSLHLPLSRDSRNELQFCWLLKYSLLKQRGYYISEKKNISNQTNNPRKRSGKSCFITFPNTYNFVKNTRLSVVFSTLFSVIGNLVKRCLSCLIYYMKNCIKNQLKSLFITGQEYEELSM